jgi:hypothetical protein
MQVEKLAFNVLGDATATCVLGDASASSAVNDAPGESPLEAVHEGDEKAEAEGAVAPSSPPGFPCPAKRAFPCPGYMHFACDVRSTWVC